MAVDADPSAFTTQIVQADWLAFDNIAEIHVQAFAERMPNVLWSITFQYAYVHEIHKATHSLDADKFQQHVSLLVKKKNMSLTMLKNAYTFLAELPPSLCEPSPCGSHSICRVINNQPECSCQPGFVGAAPNCRPECVTSSECQQQEACINQKCRNPCEGTCGLGAECRVINHNPICSCARGLIGDPFEQCLPKCNKLSFCCCFFFRLSLTRDKMTND